MSVRERIIQARTLTTQEILEFDRDIGIADHVLYGQSYRYVIDSVAPLPPDIHEIMLSIDRKYREAEERFWALRVCRGANKIRR